MRQQILFTLPSDLIKRLKQTISSGNRSEFVAKAVKKRLDKQDEFHLDEVSTLDLLGELAYRGELGRDRRQLVSEWFRELRK